jgi:hypothetical protein
VHDQALLRGVLASAYALTALLSLLAARAARGRERQFWLLAGIATAFLAAAKQLQIEDQLTRVGRAAAKSGGWYGVHREAQALFALALVVVGLGTAVLLARWLRNCSGGVKAGCAALFLLVAFLVLRAASLHAVDVWTLTPVAGMRRGWWIELAADAGICVAAVSYSIAGLKRSPEAS